MSRIVSSREDGVSIYLPCIVNTDIIYEDTEIKVGMKYTHDSNRKILYVEDLSNRWQYYFDYRTHILGQIEWYKNKFYMPRSILIDLLERKKDLIISEIDKLFMDSKYIEYFKKISKEAMMREMGR